MGISMVSALGQDRELEDSFGILSDVDRKGILKASNCQHLTYMVKDPGGWTVPNEQFSSAVLHVPSEYSEHRLGNRGELCLVPQFNK